MPGGGFRRTLNAGFWSVFTILLTFDLEVIYNRTNNELTIPWAMLTGDNHISEVGVPPGQ
jgi:hypothetical protein